MTTDWKKGKLNKSDIKKVASKVSVILFFDWLINIVSFIAELLLHPSVVWNRSATEY